MMYAVKSLSKTSVIGRSHGVKSVQNELLILKLIGGKCPFLCGLRYAFQDNVFLYMVGIPH